jgi:plastocyanin
MHRKIGSLGSVVRVAAAGVGGLALVAGPWAATSAQAAELKYVSGPGSVFTGYTVPALVIRAGDTVTYHNADIAPHDVVAEDRFGPDDPWCAQGGFAKGECPLVWTPTISLSGSTPIYGLNNLKAGDQVKYFCTLHANMKGTLVVLPA